MNDTIQGTPSPYAPHRFKDCMVDIESLGNGKSCCIVQIGACYFDRLTGEIGPTFKRNVDAASNGTIDAATVYWWLGQMREAQDSILASPREPIQDVLNAFREFLEPCTALWSHATFDFVAIQEAYKSQGVRPFSYRLARDIRTLIDLAKVSMSAFPREGTHHDGLDDAKHQVKYCVAAFQKLAKKGGLL
jgi:hypothetical protein